MGGGGEALEEHRTCHVWEGVVLPGQQVRVTSDRGPLKGEIGVVEEIQWLEGRSFYGLRLPPPHHEVLFWVKIWEVSRTSWT